MGAADRIAETILKMGQIRADEAQRVGQINAQQQANSAQIWGGTLQSLGQIPGEIAKAKVLDTENQIRQTQLAREQELTAAGHRADQVVKSLYTTDASGALQLDPQKLSELPARFAQQGVPPEVSDRYTGMLKDSNGILASIRKEQLAHQVDLSKFVLSHVKPGEELQPGAALTVLKLAQAAGIGTADDVNKFMAGLNQGHSPEDLFKAIIQYGTQPKEQKFGTAAPGSVIYSETTGQPVAQAPERPPAPGAGQHVINGQLIGPTGERIGEPVPPQTEPSTRNPTQVDLALKAAQGDPVAAAALRLLNPEKAPGALTPDASAKRADARTVAQGIKQFTETGQGLSPEILLSSRTTEQGMALNAELQKMGVDTAKLTREWTAAKSAIRNLNGASQLRLVEVINKASASLDKLDELNQQWADAAPRFGIKVLNHGTLRAAQNGAFGPDAASIAQRLEGQIADVTAELGQGIMGGNSPTDRALILASKNLSGDWSQKVLGDSIKQSRYNLNLAQQARNELLEQLGVQGTQFNTPPPVAPPVAPSAAPAAPQGLTGNPLVDRLNQRRKP